jgi:hypothetical protein
MRIFLLTILLMACPMAAFGQWDFSKHSIPLDEIQSGADRP